MMTDRFLCRGKRTDNGEWVEGYYINYTNHVNGLHQIADGRNHSYGVDPATVGQCIGLTDKNGKLIYEGDIVVAVYGKCYNDKNGLRRVCTVIWHEKFGAFGLKVNNSEVIVHLWDTRCSNDVKVIGNIHDNPELLEVAK